MAPSVRVCPDCGARNEVERSRCPECGLELSSSARDRSLVGALVGPYRIEEVRRRTPTGTAFLATDVGTGRIVELKVVSLAGSSPALRERWRREAGRRIRRPGIARVVDAGEAGEIAYVAVEMDLAEVPLSDVAPLEWRGALALGRDVAEALAFLHGQGLVHRGISPSSVLVERESRGVTLADLGLVAASERPEGGLDAQGGQGAPGAQHAQGGQGAQGPSARHGHEVTGSQEVLGDPSYTAPEARGRSGGPAADLYSLGAVIAFALTGKAPFGADLEGRAPARPEVAGLPEDARELVAALTDPDPARRPRDAFEVARRLAAALGEAISAQPEGLERHGDTCLVAPPPRAPAETPSSGLRRRRIVVPGYSEAAGAGALESSTLDLLPLPLARALLAAWPPDPARADAAFALWERLAQHLAALGASLLLETDRPLPAALSERPFRPSFGRWLSIARETLLALDDGDEVARMARALLFSRPKGASRELHETIAEVVKQRNRRAHHGAGDSTARDLVEPLVGLVRDCELFRRGRLVAIEEARVAGPAEVEYRPKELTGLAPRRGRAFRGAIGLLEGRVYLRLVDAPRFVDLEPFLAWREGRLHLLQGADARERPEYLDLDLGTSVKAPDLAPAIAALLGTRGKGEAAGAATPASGSGAATTPAGARLSSPPRALAPGDPGAPPAVSPGAPPAAALAAASPIGSPAVTTASPGASPTLTSALPAEETEPLAGKVLGGNYRIARKIGSGGYGAVYQGWDERLRRKVAVKVLSGGGLSSPEARARFEGEARTLASIAHPRVVRLYDAGEEGGLAFHAMELLPGPTLDGWIVARAPDEPSRSAALANLSRDDVRRMARWIRDAARAAHEAHERGIVHRDLKPANLMLDEKGDVRILDFGLAHVKGEELTRTRAQLGTPRYMAPEQESDSKRVGPPADVYALGACLHALLSLGKPFHDAKDDREVLARVRLGKIAPLASRNPRAPEDLATVVAKAMELDPERRYASAAALADDVDRWLEGRPIKARPAGVVERAVKWARREPAKAVAVGVLVAATVGMSLLAAWALSERAVAARQTGIAEAKTAEAERQAGIAKEQTAEARAQAFRAEVGRLELELQKLWDLRDREGEQDPAKVVVAAAQLYETSREVTRKAGVDLPVGDDVRSRATEVLDSARNLAHRTASGLVRREGPSVIGVPAAPRCAVFSPDGKEIAAGMGHLVVIWDRESGRPVRILEGHTDEVRGCAFSPDGREVLSASEDRTLRLWDRGSGRLIRSFEGHTGPVSACAFSPEGREVLSASWDTSLRLWDRASGRLVRSYEGHSEPVSACAFSPDGREVLSASLVGTLRLWDQASGRLIRSFEGHTQQVSACAFSPDGREVLSASWDKSLRLWDGASGRLLRSFVGHTGIVVACAVSPDGREVLSASLDRTLRLWDLASGRLLRSFVGHTGMVVACAFSPDGREILAASVDRTLRLWDRASGRLIRSFEGHTEQVSACSFSPDGQEVLSASKDQTLRLWDRASGRLIRSFEGHSGPVWACAFSPDGREVLSASEDKTLRLWDRASGRLIRSFEGHTDAVLACAFSPDGREVLSASEDKTLRLWDRASGRLIRSFEGHTDAVLACAFSPNGGEVLSASADSTLRLWNRASGRLIRSFEGDSGPVTACAFSPDSREILSASGDKTLRLWDRASGRLIRSFEGHSDAVLACAISPDGGEVLSASADSTLRLWDRASGRLIRRFEGHSGPVRACAFSPEGREVLSASYDSTLRLWDRASGRLIRSFEGHTERVWACAFSPDGREVLSAWDDKTLRLWDRASGRLLRSFEDHTGPVLACAFSPDGREVLSASDKTLRLWDRASGRLIRSFEGHTGPVLACVFSPDSREVLSASVDQTLRLWDQASGRLLRSFEGHTGLFVACAFSPDGREILSASQDQTLRLWDRASGRLIRSFEGHTGSVWACAFSPDGREILSASEDQTHRLWDRASGRLIRSYEGHSGPVWACAFSPGGREVLSASGDKTLRLWDRASGRLIRSYEGHSELVWACAFSPDGREVLSASWDQTLRLWDRGLPLSFDDTFPGFDAAPVATARRVMANLTFHGRPTAPTLDQFPRLVDVNPNPATPTRVDLSTPEALYARGLDLLLARSSPLPGAQSGRAYLAAAAEQGHARAARRLAWAIERCLGGPRDLEESERLRAQAATTTVTATAMAGPEDPLALVVRAVAMKDVTLLRECSARNEPDALLALADLVPEGEAAALIEKAALLGDPAGILRKGEIVGKTDPLAAMDLYERAAELGERRACLVLAHVYEDGIGVAKDAAKAEEYRGRASK